MATRMAKVTSAKANRCALLMAATPARERLGDRNRNGREYLRV
jgi:hypothetical protein